MELDRTCEAQEILEGIIADPHTDKLNRALATFALMEVLKGERGARDDEDPED